jgi:acyl carrier protein
MSAGNESDSLGIAEVAQEILSARYHELFDSVRRCIVDLLLVEAESVSGESELLELGAQSLDFIQFVFRLEQTYYVRLPRSYAVPGPLTVDSFVRAIAFAIAERASE